MAERRASTGAMSDGSPNVEPNSREACYVRARRTLSLRPGVVFEAVTRRDGQNVVLLRSKKVPGDSEEAATVLDQLIRQLFREGWIPTQEPLFVGEGVLGVYVRPRRHTD